ncbi:uncharacterized protein ARMOST_00860 [Armillaria ostoyae]|uniref:Uncharacterized protein n=1 Tax=Armillaria ostoyae TaxID=47428 RepID=A0A284QMC0_ARMOS|nr:uncharacterized protein ARMOST_00860 [Armillaria ostoyae]
MSMSSEEMDLPSLSTSGSIQSHISTSVSKKRLRAHLAKDLPHVVTNAGLPTLPPRRSRRLAIYLAFHDGLMTEIHSIWSWQLTNNAYLRLTFLTYACFSLFFISASLYCFWVRPLNTPSAVDLGEPWHLSTARRISRIASHRPMQSGLEPFVVFSEISGSLKGPTACLWTNDSIDLGSLVNWARYWRGPVSLVITTNSAPSASAYQNLLRRLTAIKTLPSLAYFSVHIFQTNTQASLSPNIFLNIGRLFAPTDTVMIVPAEISTVTPSAELYHSVSGHLSHHLQIPAVLSIAKEIAFPVASFSPLVVPRDYPVWCTDRFFLASSRSSDWDVCLWQIWLEQQGKIGQVNVSMSHAPDPTVVPSAIVILPSLSPAHINTATSR